MWTTQSRLLPALDEQVIGIDAVDGDTVSWWTRTEDGWYVSTSRGNIGHRDSMRAENSVGPSLWTHAPRKAWSAGVSSKGATDEEGRA